MIKINSYFSLFLLTILLAACSKSDEQREFENHAKYNQPSGITEMTPTGDRVPDKEDPDDWRVSPMYRGPIEITPPYPNPVALNSNFYINIYIYGIETLNALEIYALELPGSIYGPVHVKQNLSSTGLVTINLSAAMVADPSAGSQAPNIYRILIYDGNQNLISYGDVRIL